MSQEVSLQKPEAPEAPAQGPSEIILITDEGHRGNPLEPLERYFSIEKHLLAGSPLSTDGPPDRRPVIIDVDLVKPARFSRVYSLLDKHRGGRLAVLRTHNRRAILRAHDLGAPDFHILPLDEAAVRSDLQTLLNRSAESGWQELTQTQRAALRVSLKCFEDCMGDGGAGRPLPVAAVKDSIKHVLAATASVTLDDWMSALRSHHNYTFRHSMFVSGTMAIFAQAIGIGGSDLETLSTGGMLHDIGKAKIPSALLDNPDALEGADWEKMRTHPAYAREVLQDGAGLSAAVVDIAIHHHERLDGSGYPSGLRGSEINDFVRIASICDTYSNLIDKRGNKPAMDKEAAIDIMWEPDSGLDPHLVRAFGDFIMGDG